MFILKKNDRTINIFNSQHDADFFHKTRHQKHLYKVENSIEEISEQRYYELLECLPPIYLDGFIFASSEPIDHFNFQGKFTPMYQGCFQKGGAYFQFITTLDLVKNLLPYDFEV
jgi:hypothetical protein